MGENIRTDWVSFIFEGRKFSGIVPTRKDWEQVVKRYEEDGGVDLLKRARVFSIRLSNKERGVPRFGLTSEYRGKVSLGEWAAEHGLEL